MSGAGLPAPRAVASPLGRLAVLGRALADGDEGTRLRAAEELLALARAEQRRVADRGSWSTAELDQLLSVLLVEPERFAADPGFRARVVPVLAAALDPAAPRALREALLAELNQVRGFDFATSESVEAAWGAAPRRALERRSDRRGRIEDDPELPITTSIYSFPSWLVAPEQAAALMTAVRAAGGDRLLLALVDPPASKALEPVAAAGALRLLATYGRDYSPWPRDPLSFARLPDGGVQLVLRPNLQRGREADATLGLELLQNLPADVDRDWGGRGDGAPGATWTVAPVPFHNGQVLLAEGALWTTLHAVEQRTLTLLGLRRVPVESFTTAAGIDSYLEAASRAAAELSELYARPVRFVHPWPAAAPAPAAVAVGSAVPVAESGAPESAGSLGLAARVGAMRRLGGGAGFDLDSLLTLIPGGDGKPAALVGDLDAARRLLAAGEPAGWEPVVAAYELAVPAGELSRHLLAALATPRALALDAYLDSIAEHLGAEGLEVRRLPLLLVPMALRREPVGQHQEDFLIGWNNVVVETRPGKPPRAEGFASLYAAGDRLAGTVFGELGVRLELLPPLVGSVVRNGGYRCASNHLRALSPAG